MKLQFLGAAREVTGSCTLIEAAGRPGRTGGNMVQTLLSAVERFSPEAYLTACKRAVETGDGQRVRTMVDVAESVAALPPEGRGRSHRPSSPATCSA